jgi:pantoate--beta-alanine ligase
MSSRNAYLTPEQRRVAPVLNRVLVEVAAEVAAGGDIDQSTSAGKATLTKAGFDPIDYVEVCDAETLKRATTHAGRPRRVLAAAWLGKTRLIDNVAV